MKRIYIKLIIIIGIGLLFVGLFFLVVNLNVKLQLNLKEVYVAARDIPPRSFIREEDISVLKVPSIYVEDKAYIDKTEIINKYTDIQGKIPKGSLFYKSMLFEESELPDYPSTQLLDEQVSYSMEVDIEMLHGNSIVPNQRVDIYVSLTKDLEKPIVDCLIENVRVVSIRDNKGYDIDHPKSNKTPFIMILAIYENEIEYLEKAKELGDIKIYASYKTYESNEAYLNTDSKVLSYLED